MATLSSILAWRIQWTEKPGGLESIGWQKVRQDRRNLARTHDFAMIITLAIAMTITLRGLQETNTGYSLCFCCYFHFRGQIGG